MLINDSPFNISRYTDTYGNLIIKKRTNKQFQIFGFKIETGEILVESNRVYIDGLYETGIQNQITDSNYFKVDYKEGVIYFHSSKEGQVVNVNFYAKAKVDWRALNVILRDEDNLYNETSAEGAFKEIATRVNNIVANVGNSNSELVDLRVDTNNVVHSTAKGRADSDYNKLNDKIGDFEDNDLTELSIAEAVKNDRNTFSELTTINIKQVGVENLQTRVDNLTGNFNIFIPEGTYILPTINISNKNNITIIGKKGTVIKSDSDTFVFTNCNNISVDNIDFQNITSPYLYDKFADGLGYQPTVNDDIYDSLTTLQKNQNIGSNINFVSCTNVEVSRLTGNFLSIIFKDCSALKIHRNDFRGGKNFAGGILVWRTSNNAIIENINISDNIVKYASFSGICVAGANNVSITGNKIIKCGESGVKTYQNTIGGVDMRCNHVIIEYNSINQCVFDGIDFGTTYPMDTSYAGHTIIANNISRNNLHTGMTGSGKFFTIANNQVENNATYGLNGVIDESIISNNTFSNNNASNSGLHECNITGVNNIVVNNLAYRDTSYSGGGFYIVSNNTTSNNKAINCSNTDYNNSVSVSNNGATINNASLSDSQVMWDMKIRSTLMQNPSTRFISYLDIATSGSETGHLTVQVPNAGTFVSPLTLMFDNSAILGANSTNNVFMPNGSVRFELVEGSNQLKIVTKYSNGTIKSANISLS